ncbi:MAG: HAMP domain-containing sensor histidine kinase [Chloroflexota bacterium]
MGLTAALAVGLVTLAIANTYFDRVETRYLSQSAGEIATNLGTIIDDVVSVQPQLRGNGAQIARPRTIDVESSAINQRLRTIAAFFSFMAQSRVAILDAQGEPIVQSAPDWVEKYVKVDLDAEGPLKISLLDAISDAVADESKTPAIVSVRPNMMGGGWWMEVFKSRVDSNNAGRVADLDFAVLPRSDLTVREPVKLDNGRIVGFVELSDGPAYGEAMLRGIRLALLGGAIAALILAVIVGVLSARQFVRPLHSLGATADRLAAGELSARSDITRSDEVGLLAQRFNVMADQLESMVKRTVSDRESLRRFVADASHELRTPLTALKTFFSIWSRSDSSGESDAEMLQASQEQIQRLDSLTTSLLTLSRLDTQLDNELFRVADIRPVIASAAAAFSPQMEAAHLSLNQEIPSTPVIVRHDAELLGSAVNNLLSNALKFSSPGGSVTIGLSTSSGNAMVWVQDSGPGIAKAERERLFERFYRASTSRGTEGSGLGLALVKAVAEAHGGRVTLEGDGYSRFTLVLPLASESQVTLYL